MNTSKISILYRLSSDLKLPKDYNMNFLMASRRRPVYALMISLAVLCLWIPSEGFSVEVFQQHLRTTTGTSTRVNRLWTTGGKIPDDRPHEESSRASNVRETDLGRMARGIARTGWKELGALQVGDVVVAKYEIPSLSIWEDCGYEITDLYAQGVNGETGQVEQIALGTLADKVPKSGYTRYMKVYSPRYHSAPVVVTPEEIGVVTLKAELFEAMLLAIPGFFWVFVASSFASYYNDKYGGNFFDAIFRT